MPHYLSDKFGHERFLRKMSFRDVAIGIGFHNINKGMNQLVTFEREGYASGDIVKRVSAFFGWDLVEVKALIDRERREDEEARQKWLDEPIEPYVVKKLIPGVYGYGKIPKECTDQASMEEYARKLSLTFPEGTTLVLTRRLSIRYILGEKKFEIHDPKNLPRMYIKGNENRPFLLNTEPDEQAKK